MNDNVWVTRLWQVEHEAQLLTAAAVPMGLQMHDGKESRREKLLTHLFSVPPPTAIRPNHK